MAPKFVILLCHLGGTVCNSDEGVAYDKPPGKAIKVQRGIKFSEFIKQIYLATSIDKEQFHMKVICRFPSFVEKDMKYIPLPITDDDDIEIIFHTLSRHQQISNIDIYLELEANKRQCQQGVWAGKQKAIEHVFGNWDDSYNALPKFFEALKHYNPGTIVEWCTARLPDVDSVEFRHVFWAFAPSINGFKHCRPAISIDATHLYGKYKGKMMIAMGVDGNNQIFPLAFAIAETESYDSWYWFLHHVKRHVVKDHEGICLLSDRHPGILKVVNEQRSPWLEPRGFHRYCLRHFVNNFHDKFRNSQLKLLAYRAGSQNQVRKFESIMEEIGKLNQEARRWLEGNPISRWALAHDSGKRYGMLTTNMSEIFNSALKGARFLPITACVQLTFYRVVHYFNVRRSLGSVARANGTLYTPHVIAKQAASMSKASGHTLRSFNREKGIFEVITQRGKNVQVVNLEKKTCTCGKWEINKYPCSHVLCACASLSLDSWQYVQRYYSIFEYSATWASQFSPLPHEEYWPQSSLTLLPNSDSKRTEKGRPKTTRLRNGMDIKEGKRANNCKICRQSGHNEKTCGSKPRRMPNGS